MNVSNVIVLVEGKTEQIFIQNVLQPYLAQKNIFIKPIIISKKGQKGGDVKFARVKDDIGTHLKQQSHTFLSLFIDYYGLKNDWPGLAESKQQITQRDKAKKINEHTKSEVQKLFGDRRPDKRFILYIAMHEFEALLFADPQILSKHLNVAPIIIQQILDECGEPENINEFSQTAPSKRLEKLSSRFKKTTTGTAIAEAIGISKIRQTCPIFNSWLTTIEQLTSTQ